MKLPISPRLLCCAAQVQPGARVADIGADHGYLSIELLLHRQATFVHACDLREQPLRRAMENALRYGVAGQMRFSRADGLSAVDPAQVDTIVCAGMGGDLIARILADAPWLRAADYHLIFQPQSSGNDLRRKLGPLGFGIETETLVEDGGFLYQVLTARFGNPAELRPGEQYVSPALRAAGGPLLLPYVSRIEAALTRTVAGLRRAASPDSRLSYYEEALLELRELRATLTAQERSPQ